MQGLTLLVFCAIAATVSAQVPIYFPHWYRKICDVCDCEYKWEVCIPTQIKYRPFLFKFGCYKKDNDPCKDYVCPKGKYCVVDIKKRTGCASSEKGGIWRPCEVNPCKFGKCIDRKGKFYCDCYPGYKGKLCDENIDECASYPCQNGGTCKDGINRFDCQCVKGFTGKRCETNIDECKSDPCQNDGTCVDGINRFDCQCVKGFTGKRCETNIDECASNPCQNGGTCIDGINRFKCRCRKGFTGNLCENASCPPKHVVDKTCTDPCKKHSDCKYGLICCSGSYYKKFCAKPYYPSSSKSDNSYY